MHLIVIVHYYLIRLFYKKTFITDYKILLLHKNVRFSNTY